MKKGLAIAIAGVIIVATAVCAYVIGSRVNDNDNTTSVPVSETSSVTQVTENTTAETTTETTTEETTTEETTTAPDTSFLTKGYYYIYDDDNTVCYVLKFSGKKINISQFEEINIYYEDPQYSKGDVKYTVEDGKLSLGKVPSDVQLPSGEFEIKKDKLYFDGKEVEQHDKLKLSYAEKHFGSR